MAREIIEEMRVPAPTPITADHVEEAKERLILERATHLDSLVARLTEPRVRRVVQPMLAGTLEGIDAYEDDFAYVRDLGLIATDAPVRAANPIYHEVILRTLAYGLQLRMTVEPRSFIRADGALDMPRLLEEFAAFWREHGEVLSSEPGYHEVAPQLVLLAYLQRVVNGGGFVDREYGIGRGRIDLLLRWPIEGADGQRAWQREAMDLKVWRAGKADPLAEGLSRLDRYLDRLSLGHGILVIFDRRKTPPGAVSAAIEATRTPSGREVRLLRA